MTVKELFDFVTDPTIREANIDEYLEKAMQISSNRALQENEKVDDEVFKHSFIPYTMNDVVDFERDFRRAKQGESLIYTTLHGLKSDLSTPRVVPVMLDEKIAEGVEKLQVVEEKKTEEEISSGSEEEDSSDEDESDSDEEGEQSGEENELEKNADGSVKAKVNNIEIHTRPRDESPNSKRVTEQSSKLRNFKQKYNFFLLFDFPKGTKKRCKRRKKRKTQKQNTQTCQKACGKAIQVEKV